MKKYLILLVFVFSIIGVNAFESYSFNLGNFSTNGNSLVMLYDGQMQFFASGLDSDEKYTLVYTEDKIKIPRKQGSSYSSNTGSSYSSKRRPMIHCITESTTNDFGMFNGIVSYDYSKFIGDKKNQKLLLFKSSDVNCKRKKAVWNYYLESNEVI
jgi:hypothetical protein